MAVVIQKYLGPNGPLKFTVKRPQWTNLNATRISRSSGHSVMSHLVSQWLPSGPAAIKVYIRPNVAPYSGPAARKVYTRPNVAPIVAQQL